MSKSPSDKPKRVLSQRDKEVRREWVARNREKCREHRRAYSRRHPDRIREQYMNYRPRKSALTAKRRKEKLGRVCGDCGRCDAEAYWSTRTSQCAACRQLETRNGRCKACGTIKTRKVGVRSRPTCRECATYRKNGPLGAWSSRILTAWDMIWTMNEDRSYFHWTDVARVTGAKEPSAKRHYDRIRSWISTLDVEAKREVVETEHGPQTVVCFNMRKLRDVLRTLVDRASGLEPEAAA